MFDEARKKFAEIGEDYKDHCAVVGFVTPTYLHVSNNTACHVSMSYGGRHTSSLNKAEGNVSIDSSKDIPEGLETGVIAVLSQVQTENRIADDKSVLKFFHWLIKESPWSACFLNPTAEDALEVGSFILDVRQKNNYLANAAIGSRLFSEFPKRFAVWDKLTDLGVDGTEAYMYSHFLSKDQSGFTLQSGWGHVPFHIEISKEYWKNFINNTPPNPGVQSYNENPTYSGISNVWGRSGNVGTASFSRIILKSLTKGVNHDIFDYKPTGNYVYKTDEDILNLVQNMKLIIEGGK
jgi:hypothetical protein